MSVGDGLQAVPRVTIAAPRCAPMTIRDELPVDHAAIREVNRAAFGRDDEADLVDRLRDAHLVIRSKVAIEAGRVVGHVLFSPVRIETENGTVAIASLAPLAVAPDRQRHAIGSALVTDGIDVCRADGWPAIVLVGDPKFYARFGFSRAPVINLTNPYSDEAFLGLELVAGALSRRSGSVRYPAAFDALSGHG
ncbi:MAG: GNAT family N-acetyltransferase [Betaproteobacteria bacterium]